MPIGNAVQRGRMVYIYDERDHQTGIVAAGSGPHDGLRGYTGSTGSVQRGRMCRRTRRDCSCGGCTRPDVSEVHGVTATQRSAIERESRETAPQWHPRST